MTHQPNQEKVFSWGLELADVVLTSHLPQCSLAAIQRLNDDPAKNIIRASSLPFSLSYKAYDDDHVYQNKYEIIAFGCQVETVSSVLSSTLEQNPPEFKFLQTEDNPFSINEQAITLFRSFLLQHPDLFQRLKKPSKPVIVTGYSLGGWVASLFSLWLLENIDPSKKSNIPICITFGSPLVGDNGFHKAIHKLCGWNPRFLQVVSDGDLLPRTFNNNSYKPFGTFLMSSPLGSSCFDDSDSILSLLEATEGSPQLLSLIDYKNLLEQLTHQIIVSKGASQLHELRGDPLRSGIALQLEAIGDKRMKEDTEEDSLVTAMEKQERTSYQKHKKRISESEKKLNESKINMAKFEWYKKISSTTVPIGYYDSYKNKSFPRDIETVLFKKLLTKYWEDVVEEAEKKPRKQGVAPLGTRLLFGGTNYRRMAEPLDIAEYYKLKKRNYRTQGRSKHYKLLQQWQEEEERTGGHKKKSKIRAASLTEDSCFWADVEEAMILVETFKEKKAVGRPEVESPIEKLKKFEDYVMGLIDNLAVSPEIFLEESSFMKWWKEYEKIPERIHGSSLANFMENKRYRNYI